jgi:hypothetical protein
VATRRAFRASASANGTDEVRSVLTHTQDGRLKAAKQVFWQRHKKKKKGKKMRANVLLDDNSAQMTSSWLASKALKSEAMI